MSEKEFIHVAIGKELKDKAEAKAKAEDRSLSNWIRGVIRKAVGSSPNP